MFYQLIYWDKIKSGGLNVLKSFYHLKILGWSSGFRAIDDLPSPRWDETEFSIV